MRGWWVLAVAFVGGYVWCQGSDELKRLAAEDQADRTQWLSMSVEERLAVQSRDTERRKRAAELIESDALTTAEDFDSAALLFQHGTSPDDFEVARELALMAFHMGRPTSLVALAEDRFLVHINRPQRFGSQFAVSGSGPLTMNRVDTGTRASVTDALRLDSLQPPLDVLQKQSTEAVEASMPAILERLKERTDNAWQITALATPESLELSKLAKGRSTQAARARVLELYAADKLAAPLDYLNAAKVLTESSEPPARLLANELAAVAFVRGQPDAGPLFALTWDRFLGGIGRPTRYGTRGTKRVRPSVSPAVRRAFGLEEAL